MEDAYQAGAIVMGLFKIRLKTTGILSKKNLFYNALAAIIALGGSTNAVLHLIAFSEDSSNRFFSG